MAENTNIEWADHTFNPWEGCTKVGPGCDHCYAENRNQRFSKGINWGAGAPRRRTSEANWRKPIKWNAEVFYVCQSCGWRGPEGKTHPMVHCCTCGGSLKKTRPRVFCASLADVFDNEIDIVWRDDLFDIIDSTPNLDWLLLTKRIGNVEQMLIDIYRDKLPDNVHLGATIVNQTEADRDIQRLLKIKARFHFLSIEPLLSKIDLTFNDYSDGMIVQKMHSVNQVIVGGESGHDARLAHPDWVRFLRDQCEAYGVAFLFKQWGEWEPRDVVESELAESLEVQGKYIYFDGCHFVKVGKKKAGRVLDGKTHTEYPVVRDQ